jgi:hypothetical protein
MNGCATRTKGARHGRRPLQKPKMPGSTTPTNVVGENAAGTWGTQICLSAARPGHPSFCFRSQEGDTCYLQVLRGVEVRRIQSKFSVLQFRVLGSGNLQLLLSHDGGDTVRDVTRLSASS